MEGSLLNSFIYNIQHSLSEEEEGEEDDDTIKLFMKQVCLRRAMIDASQHEECDQSVTTAHGRSHPTTCPRSTQNARTHTTVSGVKEVREVQQQWHTYRSTCRHGQVVARLSVGGRLRRETSATTEW